MGDRQWRVILRKENCFDKVEDKPSKAGEARELIEIDAKEGGRSETGEALQGSVRFCPTRTNAGVAVIRGSFAACWCDKSLKEQH